VKKILVLSDTHGYLDEAILRYAAEADEIWHAGDIGHVQVYDHLKEIGPVKAVYGNIDNHEIRSFLPECCNFECEGLKVMMIHIAGQPGRYPARLKAEIERERPGLLVCGHSHILRVERVAQPVPLLHLNPGAAGKHGFHQVQTLLRFRMHEGKISDMEAVELGRRSGSAQTIG
jgi:putative phosphoesterase